MSPTQASDIVIMLANSYPVPAWTLEQQDLFARMIEDLDCAPTEAAVVRWIQTQRERPTVADVRDAVRAALDRADPATADLEAEQAWGLVVKAMRSVGRYKRFPRTNPLLAEAVEAFGWQALCNAESLELVRGPFLRFYGAYLRRRREGISASPALTHREREALPALQQKAFPAPAATREQGVGLVRQLVAAIGGESTRPTQAVADPAEPPRVPTDAELSAAEQRRAALREQLEVIQGGKDDDRRRA